MSLRSRVPRPRVDVGFVSRDQSSVSVTEMDWDQSSLRVRVGCRSSLSPRDILSSLAVLKLAGLTAIAAPET